MSGMRIRVASLAVCLLAAGAWAEEWLVVGTRAAGMGGAGVAITRDETTVYWNPAGLCRGGVAAAGFNLGVTMGAEGGALQKVDRLYDVVTQPGVNGYTLQEALDVLQSTLTDNTQPVDQKVAALEDLLATFNEISSLAQVDDEGFLASASTGLYGKMKGFGIALTVAGYGGMTPFVNLDDAAGWNLVKGNVDTEQQFEQLYGTTLDNVGGHTVSHTDLVTSLQQIVLNVDPALDPSRAANAANEFVYRAEQAGVNLDDPVIQSLVENAVEGTASATGGAESVFDYNAGITLRSLYLQQVSFGYARPFGPGDIASVGLALNVLQGETRYLRYDMQDLKSGADIIKDIDEKKNTKTSVALDADLGVLVHPVPFVSVGVTAKHLLSPEFDLDDAVVAETGKKSFKLDPQVRFGVAVEMPKVSAALDVDVTENESDLIDGYKSRVVALGVEVRPIGMLALRAGAYDNLSSDETGIVYTAGLGLRLLKFSLDLAGSMAADSVEIEAGDNAESVHERYGFSLAVTFNTHF